MSENSLHTNLINSMKAAAWERAKGALREVVAIEGSKIGGPDRKDGKDGYLFEQLEDEFEAMIKRIEIDELHL